MNICMIRDDEYYSNISVKLLPRFVLTEGVKGHDANFVGCGICQ